MRLEGGNLVPAASLSQVADFINTFADRIHHGKEETLLFPVLERHGISREGGPLGAMEREHEFERKLLGELRLAIAEYRDGDNEATRRFVEAARTYIRTLIGHIETEDRILFTIGDEMLSDEDKTMLAQSFREAEERVGVDVLHKYESLATELEEKWAL
jgi:hemerythrin-like domain-containing protein